MTDLTTYGYAGPAAQDAARVTAVHKERYELISVYGELYGRLKSGVYLTGGAVYPTAGDFVKIQYNPLGDSLITETLPRRSYFSRLSPTPGAGAQAVAANFDYVFILTSLNQNFNLHRIERYLALAWQSGAQPVVLLTKADLCADFGRSLGETRAVAPGAPVHAVSAVSGYGLKDLEAYLTPGKTLVFLGSSGVGKSSLVNALAGGAVMAVNEIRQSDSEGRHTTTHRQLVMLPSGVMVIDTPGMRELGMWDAVSGVGAAFADVEEILSRPCRFADCRHETEPGCAVKAAIDEGELSPERWKDYLALKEEAWRSDHFAEAMRKKAERNKQIAKMSKQLQKDRRK